MIDFNYELITQLKRWKMIDIIFNNLLNVIGIIVLFILTSDVKDYLIEDLIRDDLFAKEIREFHDQQFKDKYKKLLFKGFFVCLIIGLVFSFALGRAKCDDIDYTTQTCVSYVENSAFTPTTFQRVSVFTTVFSYTYLIVLLTAYEGKKKHKMIKYNLHNDNMNL